MTTIELINPATLLVDRNVRADLRLDKDFVASIKTHGVLVPIVAVRADDGVRVRAGHRRTAAAIEAGLDSVPVVISDTDDDDAVRIVQQMVENHHRTGLTDLDTINAVEQLAMLGLSATAITRRTRLPKAHVEAATTVAASTTARSVLADHTALTLEQAAWLAEFDDDDDAVAHLLDVFARNPGGGRWAVEQARRNRDEHTAYRAAVDQLTAAGCTVIDPPGYDETTVARLDALTNGQPGGPAITDDEHRTCPGAVVWLQHDWLDPDQVADDDPDHIVSGGHVWRVRHGCRAWRDHHQARHHTSKNGSPGGNTADDDAEQRKAERRRVIALNRAGEAARTIRVEWLTSFSQRKNAPAGAAAFLLAGSLAGDSAAGQDASRGIHALTEALALPDGTSLADHAAAATPGRLLHLTLCLRLWAYETSCDREVWRYPRQHARYLKALGEWGYPLTPAEQVAVGDLTAEQGHTALDT